MPDAPIIPPELNRPVTQEDLRTAIGMTHYADLARMLNSVSTDTERHSARMNAKFDQAAGKQQSAATGATNSPDGQSVGEDGTMGGVYMPMNSPTVIHQYVPSKQSSAAVVVAIVLSAIGLALLCCVIMLKPVAPAVIPPEPTPVPSPVTPPSPNPLPTPAPNGYDVIPSVR